MGFLRKIGKLFTRGRELRGEVSELRGEVKALREEIGELRERVEAINTAGVKSITAKQILNEYLYGENGDE